MRHIIFQKFYQKTKIKFIHYFILENSREFIKVSKILTNVLNPTQLALRGFKFCLENKIKLIYSATSTSLGNKGNDKNLSPYAFTKSKNLELLSNLKKWFKFKFEIIYFYNVYGDKQISSGPMATVIGIFQNQYKRKNH